MPSVGAGRGRDHVQGCEVRAVAVVGRRLRGLVGPGGPRGDETPSPGDRCALWCATAAERRDGPAAARRVVAAARVRRNRAQGWHRLRRVIEQLADDVDQPRRGRRLRAWAMPPRFFASSEVLDERGVRRLRLRQARAERLIARDQPLVLRLLRLALVLDRGLLAGELAVEEQRLRGGVFGVAVELLDLGRVGQREQARRAVSSSQPVGLVGCPFVAVGCRWRAADAIRRRRLR